MNQYKNIKFYIFRNNIIKKLSKKLSDACIFLYSDSTEIDRDDEEEFKLSDIAETENNFKVFFLSLKGEEKNKIKMR